MAFICSRESMESFWKRPTGHVTNATEEREQQWVSDGSVDIRGRPALRAKTGGWKASLFIIGVEVTERLTYFGIAGNLMMYLTTVLHEELATSAKNVNNWTGITTVIPLVGGFIADAYCGRYWMVFISSLIYLLGLILLTLSVSLPVLRPPQCEKINVMCTTKATPEQIGIFFLALYLISFGTGGHKPSLEAFGADQFDEQDEHEKIKKASFFNWWFFGISGGVLFSVTVVIYIQDNVSWGLGFGIPTLAMLVSIVLFVYGTPFYRHKIPAGSPIVSIAKVFVAAFRNRNRSLPSDVGLLYEVWDVESVKHGQRLLSHTDNYRFLDKAAIMDPPPLEYGSTTTQSRIQAHTKSPPPCTVTQVEEVKLLLRMVPIWLSCLMFGVTIAQTTTFYIKQGKSMDRRLAKDWTIQIPPASLFAFSALSILISVALYDKYFVPMARRITGNKRGITIHQRIGSGMFVSVIGMITAALVESKRLNVSKMHGLLDSPKTTIPMSIFWLIPQYVLNGIGDVLAVVGLQEYFYDQVPDSMRSLGLAFYLSGVGIASFLSSLIITITDKITSSGGKHQGWFDNNINRCHLDYFYWLIAVLSAFNLVFYGYVAQGYTYKQVTQKDVLTSKQSLPSHHDDPVIST